MTVELGFVRYYKPSDLGNVLEDMMSELEQDENILKIRLNTHGYMKDEVGEVLKGFRSDQDLFDTVQGTRIIKFRTIDGKDLVAEHKEEMRRRREVDTFKKELETVIRKACVGEQQECDDEKFSSILGNTGDKDLWLLIDSNTVDIEVKQTDGTWEVWVYKVRIDDVEAFQKKYNTLVSAITSLVGENNFFITHIAVSRIAKVVGKETIEKYIKRQ